MKKWPIFSSARKLIHHTSLWIWLSVFLAALACGAISWQHIRNQRQLYVAQEKIENLRLARIDLNKGFLYLSLSGSPDSPFNHEQGIALLEQATQTFEASVDFLEPNQQESAKTFRKSISLFNQAITNRQEPGASQSFKATSLRILFNDLERQADRVDHLAQITVQNLNNQLETEFIVVIGVDTLLLLGVCMVVVLSERVKNKSELALRQSEAQFRNMFENNHTPMMLIDPDNGKIVDVNAVTCAVYGWSHTEITQKYIYDLNILSAEVVTAEMDKVTKKQRQYYQLQHRLASGELRDVEVFSGPIEFNGKVVLFSIVHDISQLKKAEKAIQENEIRLRFALEGANDGLWDMQLPAYSLYLSPRGCEILGYTPDEFQQAVTHLAQIVYPQDFPAAMEQVEAHIQGGAPIFEIEQRLRMKSGEWKWVQARGKLVERNKEGQPLRMTGTYTDITSRKQFQEKNEIAQMQLQELLAEADEARQVLLSVIEDQKAAEEKLTQLNAVLEQRVNERTAQLTAANKELEAFAYSVSHDLRAPLRGIDGWSMALMEDYQDQLDDRAHGYINRVRSETQRMGHLIDDLLRLSRVTRTEMKRASVNMSEMAYAIATRLQDDQTQQRVELIIQPAMLDNADPNLLEIALTNLLSNAYKFTGNQPAARIEFGKSFIAGNSTYYIRDNGAGFDMEYAKNLFGAFQRMHRQTEFPGTGIGLATVQRIITRHGGKVWADAHINQGATFYFTLGSSD
jgi:PAS domain S-box-containing protein